MNILIWFFQGFSALAFLGAGIMKLTRPYEKITENMAWAKEFSPQNVKLIGFAEVMGALGLIIPQLTGIIPVLTPIAAICLFALMAGAVYTHIRLHELNKSTAAWVLMLMALLVALGRLLIVPIK